MSKLERFDGWTTLWLRNWLDGAIRVVFKVSKWRPVICVIPQGLVLGLVPFHIFANSVDSGISAPSAGCWWHPAVWCNHHPGGKGSAQRDLDRLEKWDCVKLMMFSKVKCKVLHPDQGNPKHKYRLGGEQIGSSPEEKDLRLLVKEKVLRDLRAPSLI